MPAHDRGLRSFERFAQDPGLPDGISASLSSAGVGTARAVSRWHAHCRVDRPTARVTSRAGRNRPQNSTASTSFDPCPGGCGGGVSQGAVRERLGQRHLALLRRTLACRQDRRSLFRAAERRRGRHPRACRARWCVARGAQVSSARLAIGTGPASSLSSGNGQIGRGKSQAAALSAGASAASRLTSRSAQTTSHTSSAQPPHAPAAPQAALTASNVSAPAWTASRIIRSVTPRQWQTSMAFP
jgi:hypothetical protein